MSIVKVIEVIAQSDKGFDDAARNALKEVSKTVKNIRSLYIENFSCVVEGERIIGWRVNAKVSFIVEERK